MLHSLQGIWRVGAVELTGIFSESARSTRVPCSQTVLSQELILLPTNCPLAAVRTGAEKAAKILIGKMPTGFRTLSVLTNLTQNVGDLNRLSPDRFGDTIGREWTRRSSELLEYTGAGLATKEGIHGRKRDSQLIYDLYTMRFVGRLGAHGGQTCARFGCNPHSTLELGGGFPLRTLEYPTKISVGPGSKSSAAVNVL